MKHNKFFKQVAVVAVLSITGMGSLNAAIIQTTKGERVGLATPSLAVKSERVVGMTTANCPHTVSENVTRVSYPYSKERALDAKVSKGIEQHMVHCRRELVRSGVTRETKYIMTGEGCHK
ncbi:MAG: hypothetical protein LBH01_12010 [Verrucomicrobiales bacterium]|nr:hypothetical protein [Verrucomicrobiales bacterium]